LRCLKDQQQGFVLPEQLSRSSFVPVPRSSAQEEIQHWLRSLQDWPFDISTASSMSKVEARRAAALAHLRRFSESSMDYVNAAGLAGLAGDSALQHQLQNDAEKVLHGDMVIGK
jgi:hypothetical protein